MNETQGILAISASGLRAERIRLETAAHNLANAHSVVSGDGAPYRPLRTVIHASSGATFEGKLTGAQDPGTGLHGVGQVEVVPTGAEPRLDYDPGNPLADEQGLARAPRVNVAEEMLTVMSSVRAYEANIRVMAAMKSIAQRALDIGSGRA